MVRRALIAFMLCIALTWKSQFKHDADRSYLVLVWKQLKQHAARLRFFGVLVGLDF